MLNPIHRKKPLKEDQREKMRQAVQLQASREKEMRQRLMQKMNEKKQAQCASGGPSSDSSQAPNMPPEVQALIEQMDKIEFELDHASDTHILKGKGKANMKNSVASRNLDSSTDVITRLCPAGTELNESLKALKDSVILIRQRHPKVHFTISYRM